MFPYRDTIQYWNQVFTAIPENDPFQTLPLTELEEALAWLMQDIASVLDFGCGSGRLLFRALASGAREIWGIDIAPAAVQRLERLAVQYHLEERSHFYCGSAEALEQVSNQQMDAAIISNVLDNLIPTDAEQVLRELHRIVKPGGKILCKWNPYIAESEMDTDPCFEKISENLYRDDAGLFFWNVSDAEIEQLLQPFFQIERFVMFEMGQAQNRLYCVRNRADTEPMVSHAKSGEQEWIVSYPKPRVE